MFFVVLSVLALASVFLSAQGIYEERERIANGYGDYVIFYTGARIVRDGTASLLYDLNHQRKYQDEFAVPIRAGALPFNHPAYELIWHVPLSALSYVEAYLVWNIFNVAIVIILAGWFAARHRLELRLLYWLMPFGFYPVLVTFLQGQDSILLTFLISASFLALKRDKEISAGVLLALASFKPQFVLPIALAWLWRPHRKAIAAWFVTSTFLAVVSVWMVGIPGTIKYLELISWIDKSNYTITPAMMPNLRGLVHSVLAAKMPMAVFPLTVLLTLGVFAFIVRLWRQASYEDEHDFSLTFAVTLTLVSLTSYHAYSHDFTLLLPPSLIVTRYVLTGGGQGMVTPLLFAVLLIFWIPFPFTYGQLLRNGELAWGAVIIMTFAALTTWQLKLLPRPSSTNEISFG